MSESGGDPFYINGLGVASLRAAGYLCPPTRLSEETMAMRADEIVIVCLALLDVAICWAIYDLMDGKLTLILAG